MPDPELTGDETHAVVQFIRAQSAIGPVVSRPPVALDDEAFAATTRVYFERCAGCHGTYRRGATGPDIGEARARALGTDALAATLTHGTPSGMPAWGREGILTPDEIERLAAFLQRPPPEAPRLPMEAVRESWRVLVPPGERPDAPAHDRDWENFFAVVLRDPGQVAIFDGDTHEEVTRIATGFAVHILRASATGRHLYAVGRDGRVTLIDLWMSPPAPVAEVQGCFDARSVDGSKAPGFEERYVIEGCYWPPQYVVYDGLTLEPRQVVDLPMEARDTGERLEEVRVGVIVGSHGEPVWALALEESGYVGVVDYAQPGFPMVARIGTERFLHDGGWDATGRYFLVAANASNKMVVVDVPERRQAARIDAGVKPHPGRGANWVAPDFGPVNATVHLGEGRLLVYGADPEGHPQHAWRVVRDVPLPSAGSLFLKTHPASPWVVFDMPMSNEGDMARQVCVYGKATGAVERCWRPSDAGPAVHFEFDRDGAEVWVSVWADDGELAIYDAVTLEETDRIGGLETPTGKFNVHNTAHDVY
jgi:nitrite reductase (NO-forming)/hydroxylamine reductase